MACRVNVLGPLQVLVGAVDVTPTAPRERSLLALLATNAGRVVSVDVILDELWAQAPADKGRRALHVRVAGLRKALARAGASSLLQSAPAGYRLALDADAVDADRFLVLVQRGRDQRHEGAILAATATLSTALALWRGEPLDDVQLGLRLENEAARYRDAHAEAVEEWVEAELALGRHHDLVIDLGTLTMTSPLRERLWRQRMLCLYRVGRPAEALAVGHQFRMILAQAVGLDPGPDLGQLERDILNHASALDAPSRAASTPVTSGGREPVAQEASVHHVPVALSGFVGRADERAEIVALVGQARLVTLTGLGGIGKTRLAAETATAVARQHRDGVWWLDLAPARDAAGLLSLVTALFRVGATDSSEWPTMLAAVIDHLADRQLLLVLDNCEHLLEQAATLAHTLLTACPELHVLATSRAPLHLPGETVFAVAPLGLPSTQATAVTEVAASDAIALFAARGREAASWFTVTAENSAAVVRICRRLEGIPLALELAAARVGALSVQQIAARLDDGFAPLGGAPAAALPRHHTMEAALDWSYELLSGSEQAALRVLAVFPGSFTLGNAEAMTMGTTVPAGRADTGGRAILELVDKSLIVAEPAGRELRYRLLEPVRQYAAHKLETAKETAAAQRLHRDIVAVRVKGWRARLGGLTNGPQLLADQADLRAAFDLCWQEHDLESALELVVYQASRLANRHAEQRAGLERVLAEPGPTEHPPRAQALAVLAMITQESGPPDPTRAQNLMREASALARRLDDAVLIAWVDFAHSELELGRGRTDRAQILLEGALATFEATGPALSAGWCHERLGWVAVADDDFGRAQRHFDDAAERARADDDGDWLETHALAAQAPLKALFGDGPEGLALAHRAVTQATRFALPSARLMALTRAGETAVLAHAPAVGASHLIAAFEVLRAQADHRWVADNLETAALLFDVSGRDALAADLLETAAAVRTQAGEHRGGTRALSHEVTRCYERLLLPRRQSVPPLPTTGRQDVDRSIRSALTGLEPLSGLLTRA